MQNRTRCCCCSTLLPSSVDVAGKLTRDTSFGELKDSWIGIDEPQFFAYYKCPTCGTLNTKEYPSESIISDLYASMPPNMDSVIDSRDQESNQYEYARIVASCFTETSYNPLHVLEIGADRGLLCRAMAQVLPNRIASFQVVEPNVEVHEDLLNVFRDSYLNGFIFPTLENAISASTQPLDLVIAIHVFDHIFNLQSFFSSLRERLSKRGKIFFVVHNPRSTLAKVLGKRWPAYCAQHPQLLTPAGVEELAKAHSLKLCKTNRTFNHFSMAMVGSFLGIKLPSYITETQDRKSVV